MATPARLMHRTSGVTAGETARFLEERMLKSALIVTSLVGGGLEQESRILKSLLESHDVSVQVVHYTDMNMALRRADVLLSLEVVMPRSLGLAERAFLFPNSEWWHPSNESHLPRFNKILCKTQDCFEIWSRKVGMDRCAYTSFEARDLYDPSVAREEKFLHVAGKSEYKNTAAVLRCWRAYQGLPPLTVVCSNPKFNTIHIPSMTIAGSPITHYSRISEEQLKRFMNSHKYHIIPSEYEGFGHAIHEGLGCNAVVLTTDAPPMNTYEGICRAGIIPVVERIPRSLALLNKVTPSCIRAAIYDAMNSVMFDEDAPRKAFLKNREFFRSVLWSEIQ
jgi:hypothetical protein